MQVSGRMEILPWHRAVEQMGPKWTFSKALGSQEYLKKKKGSQEPPHMGVGAEEDRDDGVSSLVTMELV